MHLLNHSRHPQYFISLHSIHTVGHLTSKLSFSNRTICVYRLNTVIVNLRERTFSKTVIRMVGPFCISNCYRQATQISVMNGSFQTKSDQLPWLWPVPGFSLLPIHSSGRGQRQNNERTKCLMCVFRYTGMIVIVSTVQWQS